MHQGRRDAISDLYRLALACAPEERDTFLKQACAGDDDLRREVESLLQYETASTSFLEKAAGLTLTASEAAASLELGTSLGPYRLEALIGSGGMGDVYRAHDSKLERTVAIKVLRAGVLADGSRRRRLIREARAASALNHPHIVAIYGIDSAAGFDYIAMEHVDGVPLYKAITPGGLPVQRATAIAVQIAGALAAAHGNGLIHRDLKPANVLISAQGHVTIIDFGLSKRVESDPSVRSLDAAVLTTRTIEGTPGYAAPEQVKGEETDARTDVFAIGAILYELLTGQPAFEGPSPADRIAATLRETPRTMRAVRPDVPRDLQDVVARALAKPREDRYASAAELLADLTAVQQRLVASQVRFTQILRRPVFAGAFALLIVVAAAAGVWYWWHQSRVAWARNVAFVEADRLIAERRFEEAYRLLQRAEPFVHNDPVFREHLDAATAKWTITTQPEGAEVMVRDFDGDPNGWLPLGRAPLRDTRIARGLRVFKVALDGFHPFEATRTADPFPHPPVTHFTLRRVAETPAGMIFVGAPPSDRYGAGILPPVPLQDFWIDKYEVTNRQFKAFVAEGGYARREHWPRVVGGDGSPIPWEGTERVFADRTGRHGPSDWQLGSYPEGQDDHPVSGVSWYEAAAYCHWLDKQLPTLHHWYYASGFGPLTDVTAREGNFASHGPEAVGARRRLGSSGAYDMAGNVKEWVWNEAAPNRRYLLGGGWSEPSYMFGAHDFRAPIERLATHGFRCAKYNRPPAAEAFARIESPSRDYRTESPVSDEAFGVIAEMYRYTKRPVNARVERTEENAPHWRLEEVSFTAAYGQERVSALLFLPRNVIPPYQLIVWFPGPMAFAQAMPLGDAEGPRQTFEFLIRDGRAVAVPAVKGSYNRHLPRLRDEDHWAEIMVAGSQDIGRLIDYLETRNDIDADRVAYGGISLGAGVGPIMTAMEPRFKASILIAGGLYPHRSPPHADALNFVPRVKVPTLMVTGMHDFFFPYDRSQKPMLDLLTLPDTHKRLRAFDSGHIPAERAEVQKEVLAWLDQYLGRVKN